MVVIVWLHLHCVLGGARAIRLSIHLNIHTLCNSGMMLHGAHVSSCVHRVPHLHRCQRWSSACMQEEQKFLQQRVETLQKELEMYAERSRHEVEQLRSELNSTQEVCQLLKYVHLFKTCSDYHIMYKQYVSDCRILTCICLYVAEITSNVLKHLTWVHVPVGTAAFFGCPEPCTAGHPGKGFSHSYSRTQ